MATEKRLCDPTGDSYGHNEKTTYPTGDAHGILVTEQSLVLAECNLYKLEVQFLIVSELLL